MTRILIAGAGYLGLALAERLKGAELYLARRSPLTVPGMKTIACDFTDPESLKTLPEVDVIYYAVAADDSAEQAYEKAYSIGVKNLAEHYLSRSLRPHFYLSSSTSVYRASQGEIVDEESLDLNTDGPSRYIVKGEQFIMNSGLNGAVLRYGGIYGPGRTGFVRRVREKLEKMTPNAQAFTNRIHRDDAVQIVSFLMNHGKGMQIINAVDKESSPRDTVIAWLVQRLGMELETYPSDVSLGVPKANKRVSSARLQALGYKYLFPSFREGYEGITDSL